LKGSSFQKDKQMNDYAISYLKDLKYYAANGYTVVLHNLEFIYPVLYGLFNQRFSLQESSIKSCYVTYEDYKDLIKIEADFKIILLKDKENLFCLENEIEKKLPSPLMNRFEKHIVNLTDIISKSNLFKFK
jgi:hypothetical protein